MTTTPQRELCSLTRDECNLIIDDGPVYGEEIIIDLTPERLAAAELPPDADYIIFFYNRLVFGTDVLHLRVGKKTVLRRAIDQTARSEYQILVVDPANKSIPGVPPK